MMDDVRRKREPMEYILIIIKTVKTANTPVFNQITFIYTNTELKVR